MKPFFLVICLLAMCEMLASTATQAEELPKAHSHEASIDTGPAVYPLPKGPDQWLHFSGPRHRIGDVFRWSHTHPDDPQRHVGQGQPLVGTSWRNRPYHADLFAGAIMLQNLVPGEIEQTGAFFDGFRLGYDFDHYWGGEFRLGFADSRLTYPEDETISGKSQLIIFDYSAQYYPWGDATWRPYGTLGLGAAIFQYDDVNGITRDQTQVSLPIGIGLKYFFHRRFSLRLEMLDNMALGGTEAEATHNFSFTGGFEYRFGANAPYYAD